MLEVTQAVARVNDILTARLLRLAEAELGRPPCAYAWLALGSHGRGEQVLSSDQDSAITFDGSRPGAGRPSTSCRLAGTGRRRRWPGPGCPCATAATWPRRGAARSASSGPCSAAGCDQPEPDALLRAEVFLDVRPVHGDLPVDALDRILVGGGSRGRFLVQMARAAVTFTPPLGARSAGCGPGTGPSTSSGPASPPSCCSPGCTGWPPGRPRAPPWPGWRPPRRRAR